MKCSDCSKDILPVVAIDLDGTLAEWHRGFMEFLELWDNEFRPDRYDGLDDVWSGVGEFSEWLGMSKGRYRQAKLAFRTGGFKRWMKRFKGAQHFMCELGKLPVEVWITTTRPWMRLDNVDEDTQEWLRRNRISFDYLMFDDDKYAALKRMVDPSRIILVLDDEEKQRDRCAELGLSFVLRRTSFNYGVHADIEATKYEQVLEMIVERIGMYGALHR